MYLHYSSATKSIFWSRVKLIWILELKNPAYPTIEYSYGGDGFMPFQKGITAKWNANSLD